MRVSKRCQIAELGLPSRHVDLDQPLDARRLYIDRFGPACAGWLVFAHRRSLHRRGVCDFHIPRHLRSKVPFWFVLAIECLAERPGWQVQQIDTKNLIVWRLKWLSWGYWRELATRMRNPS